MGWLHGPAPTAPHRTTGIVVCAPLGYDALCAHRSLRHVAATAAAAGYAVLRFDYDGTGDSVGSVDDPARWAAWRESIRDAVTALRESATVERVVLLGVGLGATLAATVAADHASDDASGIAGVATIAPIVSGKRCLRELRALMRVMGRAEAPAALALPEGSEEFVGLLLSAETKTAMEQVDLTTCSYPPSLRWLVLDRSDRAPNAAWLAVLAQQGATVEHAVLPGYVEMMQDPHEAELPREMIAAFQQWLETQFPQVALAPIPLHPLSTEPVSVASDAQEFPVHFGAQNALFGVVTRSASSAPLRALILINAGSNHHIGNGRMYVQFARNLARQGWMVLRFDIAGIGESAPHAGRLENEVYTPTGVDDLREAVHFVRGTLGIAQVHGAGLCSGAYNVFRAAEAGVLLDGIVVINPLTFRWRDGMSLKYPAYVMAQSATQYRESIRHWSKWVKLLRGGVDVRHAAATVVYRGREAFRGIARDAGRMVGAPAAEDIGTELHTMVRRGVRVRFIFSEGDPGEHVLRTGAGRALTRLLGKGQVTLSHLPGCDHSLSAGWMREVLWSELHRTLAA